MNNPAHTTSTPPLPPPGARPPRPIRPGFTVRCHFYLRTTVPAADIEAATGELDSAGLVETAGTDQAAPAAVAYDYAPVDIAGWHQDTALHTQMPPATGDLVWLHNQYTGAGGTYRVIERHWNYPAYGTQRWPASSTQADNCDLTLIVEHAPGPFRTSPEDR